MVQSSPKEKQGDKANGRKAGMGIVQDIKEYIHGRSVAGVE